MGCVQGSVSLGNVCDFHEKYAVGERLGEGAFGQVRIAQPHDQKASGPSSGPSAFAVKILSLQGQSQIASQRLLDQARHEYLIWQKIGYHENCLPLHESFADSSLWCYVTDRCDMSLMDCLQAGTMMSEPMLAQFFREMLSGIAHLHSLRIAHRDIKPSNFLFSESAGRVRPVKLCDFGFAALVPRMGKLMGCYGTPPYMSPEIVADRGHNLSTDIWSFAASSYLLIYYTFPYAPKSPSTRAMKQAILLDSPKPTFSRNSEVKVHPPSDLATSFVRKLLEPHAGRRCSAVQALKLPFLVTPQADNPGVKHGSSKASKNSSGLLGTPCTKLLGTATPSTAEFDPTIPMLLEKVTSQYRRVVDPTVQRSIEELLLRLPSCPPRSFSTPAKNDEAFDGLEISRRPSHCSTYSGPVQGTSRPNRARVATATVEML